MAPNYRYVPLLRTKSGETTALQHLDPAVKARLFPIMHLVAKPPAGFAKSVAQSWAGAPMALDGSYNYSITGNSTPFTATLNTMGHGGVAVVPSLPMNAAPAYLTAAKGLIGKYGPGFVVKTDFGQILTLNSWTASQGLNLSEGDLVIDAGSIAALYNQQLPAFVLHALKTYKMPASGWRSITLASSAAPKDMGTFPRGQSGVPRVDWALWQAVAPHVQFKLDYGDYGVAHPDLTDPPGLAMARATVSVRYTFDNEWLIIKGKQTGGVSGQSMASQYPAHAAAIMKYPGFSALTGCWGDQRLQQITPKAPGGRKDWVSISLNRHLSLVTHRLP